MCGIIFAYNREIENNVLHERAKKSLGLLKHRGPDDNNIETFAGGVIGHVRLSILDREHNRQPLHDPTGRYWLSFNGEIYNYKKLRGELAPHWNFKTNGDTEVLLAGLLRHGHSFLTKLEGMWSFVLWDNSNKIVFICRDRLGKKPIYYYKNKSIIYCASEIPALKVLINNTLHEDPTSTCDYMRYGLFMPGHTIYKEIKELNPASIMQISIRDNELKTSLYWKLHRQENSDSFNISKQKCMERIKESVGLRMVSDVEVGSFLSGGLDSTIVTYLAKQNYPDLKTFTVSFEDESFDESAVSKRTSELFKTDHYVEKCSLPDSKNIIGLIANNVGQPFGDPSILATSILCQVASEKVKVVLTGDGGDELFSGYKRYHAQRLLHIYKAFPGILRKYLEISVKVIPASSKHHSSSIVKQLQLFMELVENSKTNSNYISPITINDNELRHLLEGGVMGHSKNYYVDIENSNEFGMMDQDLRIYLPQDILLKVDRASMAHSLECRCPFLDSNLIEYLYSLPIYYHRGIWSGKKLLRESFRDILPSYVLKRPKQGFALPINNWFKGPMGDDLIEYSREIDSRLNINYIERMLHLHRQSKKDYSFILWNMYTYFVWKANCVI